MIGYPFRKEKTLFMNIRWNIILGVIALALLGWYYSLNQDHSDLQSLIKKPDSPEYVGNKMETTVFSPEGKNSISRFPTKWNITPKTAIRILFRR